MQELGARDRISETLLLVISFRQTFFECFEVLPEFFAPQPELLVMR